MFMKEGLDPVAVMLYLSFAFRMRFIEIDGDGHPLNEFETRSSGVTA